MKQGYQRPQSHIYTGCCTGALEQAVRWGYIPRNAAALANPPRLERREMVTLTEPEVRSFLVIAQQDRYHALYVLALTTGMRQGELLALRWDSVDLNAGTLQVRGSLPTGSRTVEVEGHRNENVTQRSATSRGNHGGGSLEGAPAAPGAGPARCWPCMAGHRARIHDEDRYRYPARQPPASLVLAVCSTKQAYPECASTICGTRLRRSCSVAPYTQRSSPSCSDFTHVDDTGHLFARATDNARRRGENVRRPAGMSSSRVRRGRSDFRHEVEDAGLEGVE